MATLRAGAVEMKVRNWEFSRVSPSEESSENCRQNQGQIGPTHNNRAKMGNNSDEAELTVKDACSRLSTLVR